MDILTRSSTGGILHFPFQPISRVCPVLCLAPVRIRLACFSGPTSPSFRQVNYRILHALYAVFFMPFLDNKPQDLSKRRTPTEDISHLAILRPQQVKMGEPDASVMHAAKEPLTTWAHVNVNVRENTGLSFCCVTGDVGFLSCVPSGPCATLSVSLSGRTVTRSGCYLPASNKRTQNPGSACPSDPGTPRPIAGRRPTLPTHRASAGAGGSRAGGRT